jgi:hypothetical protein
MLSAFIILQVPFFILLSLFLLWRVRSKDMPGKLALGFMFFYLFVLGFILLPYRARIKKYFGNFQAKVKEKTVVVHQRLNPKVTACSCTGMHLTRDSYPNKHRPMAISTTKNGYILNDQILQKKIKSKKLVKVIEGDGFYMQEATYSSHILTPLANKRLLELGRRFRSLITKAENQKDYFVVSSMTRTEAQQVAVRKSNPGQATKDRSTHSYGVSFDISRINSKGDCLVSYTALQTALEQMRSEGLILLCPESTCVHVTVVK